jgi:NADPH:quinone reductase-like Zn-dependent oxidoreductase
VKAFVIDCYKPADGGHLADVDDPVADAGQVLVQVHAAGVNQLDAKVRDGELAMILRFVRLFQFETLHAAGAEAVR